MATKNNVSEKMHSRFIFPYSIIHSSPTLARCTFSLFPFRGVSKNKILIKGDTKSDKIHYYHNTMWQQEILSSDIQKSSECFFSKENVCCDNQSVTHSISQPAPMLGMFSS